VSEDHLDSVMIVRPCRWINPMTVGVYMFNSAMSAVGRSEVTRDCATGLSSRKAATVGKGPCEFDGQSYTQRAGKACTHAWGRDRATS